MIARHIASTCNAGRRTMLNMIMVGRWRMVINVIMVGSWRTCMADSEWWTELSWGGSMGCMTIVVGGNVVT